MTSRTARIQAALVMAAAMQGFAAVTLVGVVQVVTSSPCASHGVILQVVTALTAFANAISAGVAHRAQNGYALTSAGATVFARPVSAFAEMDGKARIVPSELGRAPSLRLPGRCQLSLQFSKRQSISRHGPLSALAALALPQGPPRRGQRCLGQSSAQWVVHLHLPLLLRLLRLHRMQFRRASKSRHLERQRLDSKLCLQLQWRKPTTRTWCCWRKTVRPRTSPLCSRRACLMVAFPRRLPSLLFALSIVN